MNPADGTQFVVGPRGDPDRYRVGALHSIGGEGVVYRGLDLRAPDADEFAIKALHSTTHAAATQADVGADLGTDWRLQVEVLRTINHRGVVAIRDGFIGPPIHERSVGPEGDESTAYVVMTWVSGPPLSKLVASADAPDPAELLRALRPVAEAIDLINSGTATNGLRLVHGDVKPENIVMRPGREAVLVDFGIARPASALLPGVGTPGYRPMPQHRGDGARPDLYALAGVVAFVLTGEPPSEAPDDLHQALEDAAVPGPVIARIVATRRAGGGDHSAAAWMEALVDELDQVSSPGRRFGTRSAAFLAVATVAVGVAAALELPRPASDGASESRCRHDVAAVWEELPPDTRPLSWLDADDNCVHDIYQRLVADPSATSGPMLAIQRGRLLAEVDAATSVARLDYARCHPVQWLQEADRFVADTNLNLTWVDRDDDCLHDAYELNAVGLDPDVADTDADGVVDSLDLGRSAEAFAHAPDSQLLYLQRLYELDSVHAVPDPTSCDPDEWAAAAVVWTEVAGLDVAWHDPDGDCLDTAYERSTTGTSALDPDSDADGVGDGTDPDVSNGTIESIDVQLNPLGVNRVGRPRPTDGPVFNQPRADGAD